MTLIVIKNKKALSMPSLMRYVLKFIYQSEGMTAEEIRTMQESIINWNQHLTYKQEIGMSAEDKEYLDTLQSLALLLRENDLGTLDSRKAMFKTHGIDYRKYHKLPEAYEAIDFWKAQQHLKQAKKDHPEDYS